MIVRVACSVCRSIFLADVPVKRPVLCPHCSDQPKPEHKPNKPRSRNRRPKSGTTKPATIVTDVG